MALSSTIQVLKVEREQRKSKRTGAEYTHFAARCIVLTDDGDVETVGVITSRGVTPELRDQLRPGTFRAVFALQVSDYGDDKGELRSMLTGLTPFTFKKPAPGAASPVAA